MKLLLVSCAIVLVIDAKKLPPNFKKCNRNEPNLKRCVFEAVKLAIPQLNRAYDEVNIPNLEPLFVEEMVVNIDLGQIKFEEYLLNATHHGLTNATLKRFEWDLENREINMAAVFPQIDVDCLHEAGGRVLGVPFNITGPSHFRYSNLNASFYISYQEVVRNNQSYVKIVESKFEGKPASIHFDLTNLVGHSDTLNRVANLWLDLNWKLFYDDLKYYYFDAMNKVWAKMFQDFFDAVSIEDAFN